MRPHPLAAISTALGFLAARPVGATAPKAHPAPHEGCAAVGGCGAAWLAGRGPAQPADTAAPVRRTRRRPPARRVRAAPPERRDTVTVVRVDTVRVRDTVTVERTLPAPPQRVDTVRIVDPRGGRRP